MRRIVTLPPDLTGDAQQAFAGQAKQGGADLLELRSDLQGGETDVRALSRVLPLLVAERTKPLPAAWTEVAVEIDRPLGAESGSIASFHASRPLTTAEAVAIWESAPVGMHLKHVEPLGELSIAHRLQETQAKLGARFGRERVTVLATGPLALPFRCALATRNALDYLALDASWAAAPGQRLLADAARERSPAAGPRRGILGANLGHSRSPRVHRQPFDRLDLPPDTALQPLLAALHPLYDGFAVTSPLKIAAARAIGSELSAVNTLIRSPAGWTGANTDVDGALAALKRFGGAALTVLGDGGATVALRLAAAQMGRGLRVVRRAEASTTLSGDILWTWPATVAPPAGLRFRGARIAIVAYGSPGRTIAATVRRLGGEPVSLGGCWFIAQARAQRRFWDGAR